MSNSMPGRILENVPGLAWGKTGDCTFVGALEAATAVTPFPCRYLDVMGATGLAFRTRWYQGPSEPRWCPSSPVGEFATETAAAAKATGWTLRYENDEQPMERLAPEFARSIDAGLPALAYDDELNMAVVCGYEDGGRTVLMHAYSHGDALVPVETASLKMMALFLDRHSEPLSPVDAARQGIRIGVESACRGFDPAGGDGRGYQLGPRALAAWRADIEAADGFTEAERGVLFFVSWWNFEALCDARRSAARFLLEAAPLFGKEERTALGEAADRYAQEARLLTVAQHSGSAFLGPWTGKSDLREWTPDVRAREVDILARAEAIERPALDELTALCEGSIQ